MNITRFNVTAGAQDFLLACMPRESSALAVCVSDAILPSGPKSLLGHSPNPARELEQGPFAAVDQKARGVLPNAQVFSAALFNFGEVLFGWCLGAVVLVAKSPSAGRPVYFSPVTPRLVGGHAS